MAENKNIKRGVEIYIDGKAVTNNIKAIEAEGRKLNKEIRGMVRGTEEYNKTASRLEKVNKILAEHRRQIKGVTEEHKSLLERANAWLNKWGAMAASVAASLTGVVFAYNKMRKELQEREDVKADVKALTGLDNESVDWLEQKAVELSTTMSENGIRIRESATEILEAYKLVGSAKPELLANKEALNAVTEQTLILAQASGMQLREAVDAVTLSMNQYGAAADEASRYANVMAAGSKYGAAAVESVTTAVQKAGVAASTAGVPVEQLVAAIEALAEKGIKDEVAGTGLKTFFLKLESQAKDLRPSVVGLQTALDNLAKKNLSAQQMIKMFGLEAYTVAQAMVSSADKVKYYTEAVTGTQTAVEQASVKSDTAAAKLAQMKNEFSELGMEIATKLQPVLGKFLGFTKGFIQSIPTILSLFGKLRTTILALTAVSIAYYVETHRQMLLDKLRVIWQDKIVASLKKMFAVMKSHPFAAVAIAVAVLIDALRNMNKQLTEAERKQKLLSEVENNAASAISAQKDEIQGLLTIARDLNKSYGEREAALKKLKEIDSDYFKDLTLEEIQTDKVTKSVDRYINRLLAVEKIRLLSEKKIEMEEKRRKAATKPSEEGGFWDDAYKTLTGLWKRFDQRVANFDEIMQKKRVMSRANEVKMLGEDIDNIDKEIQRIREEMIKAEAELQAEAAVPTGGDPQKVDYVKMRLDKIDAEFNKKIAELKQRYLAGEIESEQEFSNELTHIELERLREKMKVRGLDEKQQAQFLDRMLDMQLSLMQKLEQMAKRRTDENDIESRIKDLEKQYEEQRKAIEAAYVEGIIPTEEKYKEYLLAIEQNYEDERNSLLEKITDKRVQELRSQESAEIAQLKLQYAQRLMLEDEFNAAMLSIRKKYSDKRQALDNKSKETTKQLLAEGAEIELEQEEQNKKQFEKHVQNVKDIAEDVVGQVEAIGDKLGEALFGEDKQEAWKEFAREFLKDALAMVEKFILIKQAQVMAAAVAESATLIGAAKAIAVATAKMAAIKVAFGVAKAAVSNFYTGGFTPDGRWDQAQGIVHSNEFVANRHATNNPHVLPVLKLIDAAQKTGSIANLNGEQIASVAVGSSSSSVDNTALLKILQQLDATMLSSVAAFRKPSVAYTFLNGPGGIKDAQSYDSKIIRNAKLK